MKKHILTALLVGAIAMLSTLFVTSCNKQTEELNTRVTVLEGLVKDLEQQIKAAVVTGSTIINADQDEHGRARVKPEQKPGTQDEAYEREQNYRQRVHDEIEEQRKGSDGGRDTAPHHHDEGCGLSSGSGGGYRGKIDIRCGE